MKLNSTLLISTYNWPEALELVLESVLLQTQLPSEILIADDGSTEATKLLIKKYTPQFQIPLIHVWHEDNGFRKSVILNKAIAQAKGDYIIQVDGDCILHRNFIKDHLHHSKNDQFLFGARVNILEQHLLLLFKNKFLRFNFFSKGIKNRSRTIHNLFLSNFFKPSLQFSKKYRGCNTSFFKKDCIAVNGYNEEFTGWGREDSEFALRLLNNGIAGKRLRYAGIVFHIFHKIASKSNLNTNNQIEKETIQNQLTWCKKGIQQYL